MNIWIKRIKYVTQVQVHVLISLIRWYNQTASKDFNINNADRKSSYNYFWKNKNLWKDSLFSLATTYSYLPKLWMELWESGNKTCEPPMWELLTSCVSISLSPVCFSIPFSFCFFLVCSLYLIKRRMLHVSQFSLFAFEIHE